MKHTMKWLTSAVVAATLSLPAAAVPPANVPGAANSNAAAQGRPGSGRGLVVPNRHVYYPGDTLQVRVVYPRSLTAIWNGDAESYIVIHVPGGAAIAVPLMSDTPDAVVSLVELTDLDTSQLTPGDYQLGLVLTVPGGDPLNVDDWYGGFRGLLSIERIRFSESSDPADADGDGEFDDDADGDGFGENEALGESEDDGGDEASGDDTDGGDEASGDDTGGGDEASGDDTGGGDEASGDDTGGGDEASGDDTGGGDEASGDDAGGGDEGSGDDSDGGDDASGDESSDDGDGTTGDDTTSSTT